MLRDGLLALLPLRQRHLAVVAGLVLDAAATTVDEGEGVVHSCVQDEVGAEQAELLRGDVVVRAAPAAGDVLRVGVGADVGSAEALPDA
eukprot:1023803-Pyramimonas_sp.AAC.1